ncbi:MAG: FAD-binding oxidoreductase [Bryobacteraceae bacterium]
MSAALKPTSPEELAETLRSSAAASKTINILGRNSKRFMAGPIVPADVTISTTSLNKILHYERDDLTISVEAGMQFSALQNFLRRERQMIALDPPFSEDATVGGVVAANVSGPMRRSYGTARDMVIGMTFATLEGKLIKAGGMVVKNVAGLDMGKLMIGSFGTLAAITSVNFRVHALPETTQTFLYASNDPDVIMDTHHRVVRETQLRPTSIDVLSPPASARVDGKGYILAIRAAGSPKVLERYERELSGSQILKGAGESAWWKCMTEFPADFLRRQPGGVILRLGTPLTEIRSLLKHVSGTVVCRAGSGVSYAYLSSWRPAPPILSTAAERGWTAHVEHAPDDVRSTQELWIERQRAGSSAAFDMMEKIKRMFDPAKLLNRSRLYGKL